jgi:hypothetical protein
VTGDNYVIEQKKEVAAQDD